MRRQLCYPSVVFRHVDLEPVALVRSGTGRRGKGYAQMRKDFRALFNTAVRGERSATAIVRQCVEDPEASWDIRLKAIELALKYGFGMPERLDDEQVVIMAEKKLTAMVAEARAALGPIDVTPAEPEGDAE